MNECHLRLTKSMTATAVTASPF